MENSLARLFDIADGQWGYVTEQQAADAGFDDRAVDNLVAEHLVERAPAEILRIRAGGRPRFPSVYGAWLATDPRVPGWVRRPPSCAVAAYGSALRVHGAGDQPGPGIEFIVPTGHAIRPVRGVVYREADLASEDWTVVDGLPVTTPARTLADLASTGRLDVSDLQRIGATFLRQGRVRREELARRLGDSTGWIRHLMDTESEAGTA